MAWLGIGLVTLTAAAQTPGGGDGDRVRDYRKWKAMMPTPIDMEMPIAISCVGPAEWDADATNPHIPKVFRVFVNSKGHAELKKTYSLRPSEIRFPVGSIIVKEKFRKGDAWSPSNEPELLTAMIKREKGFDPKTGDWQFLALDRAMKRVESVEVQHCRSCHQKRAKTDFVFGNYGTLVR